jgi:histone H3/H4
MSRQARQEAAYAALSPEEKDVFDREESIPSLRRAHARRLQEVRFLQGTTDFCLDSFAFARLCKSIATSLSGAADSVWSAEALEALQTQTEAYLLKLIRSAMTNALQCNRAQLMPSDIKFVQSIWLR